MTETKRPPKRERQTQILMELRSGKPIRISELADVMNVSRETVRRDLEELDGSPLVMRTYGGAVVDHAALDPVQPKFDTGMSSERQRLAALATRLVQPHMVLMIDGGATTLHLARRLAAELKTITVITNSAPAATALATCPTITVIFCPGRYDSDRGIVTGPETVAYLSRFHANMALISASGLTKHGPSVAATDVLAVKRAMLRRAEECLLLMDHGKFGRKEDRVICPLADIDRLICDEAPNAALCAALRGAGVEICF